jgi:stringent starvation protein B
MSEVMTSNRPYLIRAIWQWITDNGLIPYILVDASAEQVEIPRQFVEDGRIVLNIGASAVLDLNMDDEFVSFNARFGGEPMDVFVPVSSVLGIYAKENGQGMLFPENEAEPAPPEPETPSPAPTRPSLKLVK